MNQLLEMLRLRLAVTKELFLTSQNCAEFHDVDVSDDSVAEDVDHDDQNKDAGNPEVSSFSCR